MKTIMGIAVKQCPFCGGEAKTRAWQDSEEKYFVECEKCGAMRMLRSGTITKAIDEWNTRHTHEAKQ